MREPGRRHVGADTHVVGQHDARAAHRRRHVDLLDQLPTGIVAKAGDMTGGIFFFAADVEAIERAASLRLERRHFFQAETPNPGAIGDIAGIGLRPLERADLAAPVGAVLEVMPCQASSRSSRFAAPAPCWRRRR